jgi:tryptophan synthase alpha chain
VTLLANRLDKIFKKLSSENRKAFVSFAVAGFPNEKQSLEVAKTIIDSGVDIHEIAYPHAEAQADGPIIQMANIESLKNGIDMDKIISMAKELRNHNQDVGLVMMGYLNNIFIYGIEKFAKAVSDIIDGMIIVDLANDVNEYDRITVALQNEGISLIKLITPTTSDKRIEEIVEDASGFIYSVNVEGITGVKEAKIETVNEQILRIKKFTSLPTVAGFGIKTSDDVKTFSKSVADGIVIGSSIVEQITNLSKSTNNITVQNEKMFEYCKDLTDSLKS